MCFWFMCYLVVVWLISASDAESCPEPPAVDNSIFVSKEGEGQILGTYFCINGYHLVGEKALFCNSSQGWNAPAPKCLVGHCPDPVLGNGEFGPLESVNVNDTVTFKCNEHYILNGSSWSRCQEDHTWVPPFPVCKSKDCGPPENPMHGYFEGIDFNSGSTVTYYCEARYCLVGTQHRQCVDGEWSGAVPVCEPIPEAPKPALQIEFEKALLAFQESKELCQAVEDFTQRLKKSGLTLEELKYSLEIEKAELKAKMWP
uniref:Complement component 4 binding protein beta n=1 Tax=Catagonus wagneri TaxID=51154 RepID=A0A8C3VQ35_9CETA